MNEIVPDTFPALFVGYTVIWLAFCFYLVKLGIRQNEIERRLDKGEKD